MSLSTASCPTLLTVSLELSLRATCCEADTDTAVRLFHRPQRSPGLSGTESQITNPTISGGIKTCGEPAQPTAAK